MPSSPTRQSALVIWKHEWFHSEPIWPRDPDVSIISTIARRHLDILETSPVSATFLSQGAFNKVYVIRSSSLTQSYIFRVTLPVDPFYKTASEVATLSYLRKHTSIPVADVIAYDASSDNELGFEWILMEHIPGVRLRDIWSPFLQEEDSESVTERTTTNRFILWEQKEEIAGTVARYVRQLRKISFECIGSLYCASDIKDARTVALEDPRFVIGPLVSMNFFYGGIRSLVPRDRGPFDNERHYAEALLNVAFDELELAQRLKEDDPLYNEGLVEGTQGRLETLKMLQTLLPSIFSPDPDPFGYVLSHHDLSLSNILVDPDTSKITGIIDWECIGIIPRWEVVFPQFLDTPDIDIYPEVPDDDPVRIERWENFERMRLRKVYDKIIREESELKHQFIFHLNGIAVWYKKAKLWAQEVQDSQRVDYATDELISKTIRRGFSDSTIITIAHRLRTVVDYNRVMLLDEGRVVEFDSPATLLSDPNSRFYALCKATGKTEFAVLKRMAGVSSSEP